MRNLVILGASGSIGQSTLKVLRQNPGRWQVLALTAARSVDAMVRDCLEFSPRFAVMVDEKAASDLAGQRHNVLAELDAVARDATADLVRRIAGLEVSSDEAAAAVKKVAA